MDNIINKFVNIILPLQIFFTTNEYPSELSELIIIACYESLDLKMYVYSDRQTQICINGNVYLSNAYCLLNPNFPKEYVNKIAHSRINSIYLANSGKVYYRDYESRNSSLIDSFNFGERAELKESIVDIATGRGHNLFLSVKGEVFSWLTYAANNGQLGVIDKNYLRHKIVKTELKDIIKVFAGDQNSFAISNNGDLYVWGRNANGSLGLGHDEHVYIPQKHNFLREPNEKIVKIISLDSTIFLTNLGNVYVVIEMKKYTIQKINLGSLKAVDIGIDKYDWYALTNDHSVYSLRKNDDHPRLALENIIQIDSCDEGTMVMTSSLEIYYLYHDWIYGHGWGPEKIHFDDGQSKKIR